MVEGLSQRIDHDMSQSPPGTIPIIATGGMARLIQPVLQRLKAAIPLTNRSAPTSAGLSRRMCISSETLELLTLKMTDESIDGKRVGNDEKYAASSWGTTEERITPEISSM